jgi:hypothetical protein
MADSWGNVSRQRLMETIVILWTLTEVPGGSNIHTPTRLPLENQAARQLTFEREKGLVEILAFLSGTTDDPSKVMAVCIEEGSAGDSLTIRLASNSGDCSDALSGFKRIATILEQSSGRGRSPQLCLQSYISNLRPQGRRARMLVTTSFGRLFALISGESCHASGRYMPRTLARQAASLL